MAENKDNFDGILQARHCIGIGSVKDAIKTTLMKCGETFLIDCKICTGCICVAVCKKAFGKYAEEEEEGEKKLYKYYYWIEIPVSTDLQYLNYFEITRHQTIDIFHHRRICTKK